VYGRAAEEKEEQMDGWMETKKVSGVDEGDIR
jgi:hypothetical protein